MAGIEGLHHVTAIAGEPQANIDFYAGVLGLRLVKVVAAQNNGVTVTYAYTGLAPKDSLRKAGRIDSELIAAAAWPNSLGPTSAT